MTEKWVVASKRADFNAIAEKFGIDPVIARLIRNRDVVGEEAIRKYLYGSLTDLYNPLYLKDLAEAATFLKTAIENRMKIRVIGDYDIDGVMASYILQKGLSRIGADVDVRIPERMKDGYGLNERLVREAHADGRQILLTCDNGIAASAELDLAYELGLKAVVTDHHEVPRTEDGSREILPRAEAVVDPKRSDCNYPYKGLCGAAIAWKLIIGLYRLLYIPEANTLDLLEYVAVATIGDVMDLTDENRILVREGLKRLHKTKNAGLNELICKNGLSPDAIDVYHISFVLGPCLNASGRLETANKALALLNAQTDEEAKRLADDLIALNASRKTMTAEGEETAMRMLEETGMCNDKIIVAYLPDCHEALAGIVAGRLKERYHRPAFVLTKAVDGVKGSGRSIEAYNMYEGLCGCSDLLTKFGGHHMAAGLSLKEKDIGAFRQRLNQNCALAEEAFIPKTVIDVAMPVSYASEGIVEQLSVLKPFGTGNRRPVFADRHLKVIDPRVLGKNRNVVKCCLETPDRYRIDAVYFGDGDAFVKETAGQIIDVVYFPEIDTFRNKNTLQARIMNYRHSAGK